MVHAGGSPRTTSPPHDEVVALGEKLVEWASVDKPPDGLLRSRFCEWYTLPEIGMIRKEWEAIIRLPEFRIYYERAQAFLGRRLIDGTINPTIGHRIMWHYVPESAEQEKEKMKYASDLRKEENTSLGNYIVQTISYATHKNNPTP